MARALVAGGSGGVGVGVARRLAAAGHDIAVGYVNSHGKAEALAREIRDAGGRAVAVRCDLGDLGSIEASVAAVREAWGGPPLVVANCAGIDLACPMARMTWGDWDELVAVNLHGTFNLVHATLPILLDAGWGRYITVSSPAGLYPHSKTGAYAATKAAISTMMRVLARELAGTGVTSNLLVPGIVESGMTKDFPPGYVEALVDAEAPGRTIRPEELGDAAAFLASDRAAMLNGTTIKIDGGGTMLLPEDRAQVRQFLVRAAAGER